MLESHVGVVLDLVEQGHSEGFTSQWLHQFRIQLRQLRSLLTLAEPFCGEGQAEKWSEWLKECFWATGSLREMDVLEELIGVISQDELKSGELNRRILIRRKELNHQWEQAWGRGQLTSLLLSVWAELENELNEKDTQEPFWNLEKWALQTTNEKVKALWLRRREDDFDEFEWSRELRSEAKQLRYALGALSEYLPIRETSKLIKYLEKLQEVLGPLQDSYCSADWMKSLHGKKANNEFYHQAGIITGWLIRDVVKAEVDARKFWKKVAQQSKKWLRYVEG